VKKEDFDVIEYLKNEQRDLYRNLRKAAKSRKKNDEDESIN
jgi:hypothetical protein